jgi:hypothetical protein
MRLERSQPTARPALGRTAAVPGLVPKAIDESGEFMAPYCDGPLNADLNSAGQTRFRLALAASVGPLNRGVERRWGTPVEALRTVEALVPLSLIAPE